jgi:uncharacterized protein
MSGARLVRVDATSPQRWRNGGGWTRELLARPAPDDWRVRISVAAIERDGAFSSFPGVRRWFAVLEGAGVELTIDGVVHRVTGADEALHFSGAAVTSCRLLAGPTRDLNLMLREPDGALARVVADRAWQPRAQRCGLFALADGRCRSDNAAMDVPRDALLWFDEAPAALAFDAAGWWIAA